jgi:hypothetical protein
VKYANTARATTDSDCGHTLSRRTIKLECTNLCQNVSRSFDFTSEGKPLLARHNWRWQYLRPRLRAEDVRQPEVNVASASVPRDSQSARIAIVEQHIRLENEHNLEGVLSTFGNAARYDDEP